MKIGSEAEMTKYGRELAEQVMAWRGSDGALVIELVGDVGVGKTTLTRGLAEGLGVKEAVTSPSFTISKAYALPDGGNLVHYDFYRLAEPGLMMEDLAESLRGKRNVVVIEWGESVAEVLPKNAYRVKILYNDDGAREVLLDVGGVKR